MLKHLLLAVFLGLLQACASDPNSDLPDSKTFEFSQLENERGRVSEAFAQELGNAMDGKTVRVNDGELTSVQLGAKYYSATGNVCRHFKSLASDQAERIACLFEDGWRKSRAIISRVPEN